MASKLGIINMALRRLGAEPIAQLDATNKRSRLMDDLYDVIRRRVLESHPWNFALKRATITADATAPAFEFTKRYALPADYLRAWKEYNDVTYKREGDWLLGDASELKLIYIADIEDEEKFNPHFVRVLYLTLAMEGSYSMNQDKTLTKELQTELDRALGEARSFMAQEQTPDDYDFNHFNDFRL